MSEPLDLDELAEQVALAIETGSRSPEHDGCNAHISALIAQVRSLRAALVKYGAHTGMCGYYPGPKANPKTGYSCVCGLYDLVDEEEFDAALGGPER